MAVNFKQLHNPIENKKIREVVIVGSENITVYEPTIEDIKKMTDFQEETMSNASKTGSVEINGEEMLRVFFPMLTDIEGLEDLSDEEIRQVVNEPSLAFLQVEQVVKAIITETFKVMILSARTQILETDFEVESSRAEKQIMDAAFNKAAREYGAEDLLNKIKNNEKELEKAIQESLKVKNEIHQEVKRESGRKPSDKIGILPFGKSPSKEEIQEEIEEANPALKAKNLLDQYKGSFSK